jgi:threonine dehydrogenase-like Zn-dependent dehydrogenase
MQPFRTAHLRAPNREAGASTMKALVYGSIGHVKLEERPKPRIFQPTDAVVKLSRSTICGTDLHITRGDVPTCVPGTILGHEGVGIIEEVGTSVRELKNGQNVLISCISSCASCEYCRKGMYSHCTTGGTLEALMAGLTKTGRMDSWKYNRWNTGRIRSNPSCRFLPLSGARRS